MKVPFSFYYKILIQVVEYLHQLGGVFQEIDALPKEYEEEQLETELERKLTDFLVQLGTCFAYMGRQKQIVVAGKLNFSVRR